MVWQAICPTHFYLSYKIFACITAYRTATPSTNAIVDIVKSVQPENLLMKETTSERINNLIKRATASNEFGKDGIGNVASVISAH